MHKVYISLGGNFENSDLLILQAIEEIENYSEFFNMKTSRLYATKPIDIVDSETDFKNVCACFETDLSVEELFEFTEELEEDLGKTPKPKNASRPIDIDILFYGDQVIKTDQLIIPHEKWNTRTFVIEPLLELTDVIYDPKLKKEVNLQDLLTKLEQTPS